MNGPGTGEELMDMNFKNDKPLKAKPKLGVRRKKPVKKGGKAVKKGPPKPWLKKKLKKGDSNITKDSSKSPVLLTKKASNQPDSKEEGIVQVGGVSGEVCVVNGQSNAMDAISAKNNKIKSVFGDEKPHLKSVDEFASLEQRLMSLDMHHRVDAFIEVRKWTHVKVTKAFFMNNLHLYVKDKEEEVLLELLAIMKAIFYSPEAKALAKMLNILMFVKNYSEFLMKSVESFKAKSLSYEIIPHIFKSIDAVEFIKQCIVILSEGTQPARVHLLLFLEQVICTGGHIREMDFLKKVYPLIKDLASISDPELQVSLLKLLKTMYLWMGPTLFEYLKLEKCEILNKLKEYSSSIDISKMKITNKQGHKVFKLDAYELEKPVELPKEYFEEKWCEDIIKEKSFEKKKVKLVEFNEILKKTKRLNPEKTNPKHFLKLANHLFSEKNNDNKVEIIKTIGYLAERLRNHFEPQSKFFMKILFIKLKIKNSKVCDMIINTLEKFYSFVCIHDTIEYYKEHLFDRSADKKKNILTLLIRLINKNKGFLKDSKCEESEVKNIVKMCIKLFEEDNSIVSNKATELIAKLLKKYEEDVVPLLDDIAPYYLNMIKKFSKENDNEMGRNDMEDGNDSGDFERNYKDKLLLIIEIREELFSGKTVKIHDLANFGRFLNKKLVILSNITDEFTDLDIFQLKEMYLLIEELVLKIEEETLVEDSKRLLVRFFFEQSNNHSSTELIRSMQFFIDSTLITPREFLLDTYEIINQDHCEINKKFIINLLRLLETELIIDKNLKKIAHEEFVIFLGYLFYDNQSIDIAEDTEKNLESQAQHIVGFMQTIENKFGMNHLELYPDHLRNKFKQDKKNTNKAIKKFLAKTNSKRRRSLEEIIETTDPQRIKFYFSQIEFLNYLKRLLIQEMDEFVYSYLVQILEKYLVLYQQNKKEFSLKNYLYVFQIIINNYATNKGETGRIDIYIDTLFHKTVKCLTPNVVFYELLEDPNNLSMREDILNFYLIYHNDIFPDRRFMEWISALVVDRALYSKDLQVLVEDVLLMLKCTENDELITLGMENQLIKDIWHLHEEKLLFHADILFGETIFESVSKFRTIKRFIMDTLKIDESQFYSKTLRRLFKRSNELKKVKAVFYLIKSYENTNRVSENIFNDIKAVDWRKSDELTQLIVTKILFNILRHKIHQGGSEFFKSVRKNLKKIANCLEANHNIYVQNFQEIFDFSQGETDFFKGLLKEDLALGFTPMNNDNDYDEEEERQAQEQQPEINQEDPELSYVLQPGNTSQSRLAMDPSNININNNTSNIYQSNFVSVQGQNLLSGQKNVYAMQSDYQSTKQSYRKNEAEHDNDKSFVFDKSVLNENKSAYGGNIYNDYDYQSNMGNNSIQSKFSKGSNNLGTRNQRRGQDQLEREDLLLHNLQLMTTFDFDNFQEGSTYIKSLLDRVTQKPPNYETVTFLIKNGNSIVLTYVTMIEGVMPAGINYQLTISHYLTMFNPIHAILLIEGIFTNLNQECIGKLIECSIGKLVNSNQQKDEFSLKVKEQPTNNELRQNHEIAEYVTKQLNSITLKIIQKCDINILLQSLFQILISTRKDPQWPSQKTQKMNSLSSKCITRSFKKIEHNLQKINPLEAIHYIIYYTEMFDETPEDQHAWKAFRTLIHELVKAFPEETIYNAYRNVMGNETENVVSRWIERASMNLPKSDNESYYMMSEKNMSVNQNQFFQPTPNFESDSVHDLIMEIINMINNEKQSKKIGKMLKEILLLVQNNGHINFELYSKYFIKPKYFDKVYRVLYNHNDNISEIQSVISSNTRQSRRPKKNNHKSRNMDNKSLRSVQKSPRKTRRQ